MKGRIGCETNSKKPYYIICIDGNVTLKKKKIAYSTLLIISGESQESDPVIYYYAAVLLHIVIYKVELCSLIP